MCLNSVLYHAKYVLRYFQTVYTHAVATTELGTWKADSNSKSLVHCEAILGYQFQAAPIGAVLAHCSA